MGERWLEGKGFFFFWSGQEGGDFCPWDQGYVHPGMRSMGDLASLPPAAGAKEVILAPLVVIQECQWLAKGKEEEGLERTMGKVTLSAI